MIVFPFVMIKLINVNNLGFLSKTVEIPFQQLISNSRYQVTTMFLHSFYSSFHCNFNILLILTNYLCRILRYFHQTYWCQRQGCTVCGWSHIRRHTQVKKDTWLENVFGCSWIGPRVACLDGQVSVVCWITKFRYSFRQHVQVRVMDYDK